MWLCVEGTRDAVRRLCSHVMVVLRRSEKLQQEDDDDQPRHKPAACRGRSALAFRGVDHVLLSCQGRAIVLQS